MFSVVGHDSQISALRQLIANEKVPHAVLFSGPPGVGKLTAARWLVSELLIQSLRPEQSTEGAKKLFASGSFPDFHLLETEEGKKDISVEQVRSLISALSLRPYSSRRIGAIINEAHRMSIAAANSLLKTLEEPNADTFLILVSSSPQRIPETVLSRCQTVQFGPLPSECVMQVLASALSLNTEQTKTLEPLAQESQGSLALLGLEGEFNSKTGAPLDGAATISKLETRQKEAAQLAQRFSILWRDDPNDAAVLSLASELAAAPMGDPEWQALRTVVRSRLFSAPATEAAVWADRLERVIESEKLIRERNLQPATALSKLFLHLAHPA